MRWLICLFLALGLASSDVLAQTSSEVGRWPFTHSGMVDPNRGGTATACFELSGAVGSSINSTCGSYALAVKGSPARVQFAGIYPDGIDSTMGEAWQFDGSSDYLDLADASADDFEPAGSFSVGAVFMKSGSGGNEYIWNKYAGAGGWLLWTDAGGRVEWFLDDGPSVLFIDAGVAATPHVPICAVATYEQAAPAVVKLYVDEIAVKTNTKAGFGPLPGNTRDLGLGALGNGANKFFGNIYRVDFWDGVVMTEAHARAYCRQWKGLMSPGGNVVTVTSTTPPATMVASPDSGAEPFFFGTPKNSAIIGRGGIYGGGPATSLAFRGSLETWAGGSPTGWTETSGGGTSDATQNTTSMAYQTSSAQMLCDGVNTLTLDSGCTALSASTAYYALGYFKSTVGTPNFSLQLIEYTSADCSTGATTTTLWGAGDPGPSSTWTRRGGTRTTGGSVQSGRVRLLLDTNSATMLADGIMLYAGAQPTDILCTSDADSSVTCNLIDVVSDPSTGEITAGEWQVNIDIQSPIDGAAATPVRQILRVPGTAGDNNRIDLSWASDTLTCTVYDSAGAAKTSTVAAAGNADTEYAISMTHTADGRVECCWAGTCDATPATGAVTDGVGSEVIYGSDGTTGGDIWLNTNIWNRRYDP